MFLIQNINTPQKHWYILGSNYICSLSVNSKISSVLPSIYAIYRSLLTCVSKYCTSCGGGGGGGGGLLK